MQKGPWQWAFWDLAWGVCVFSSWHPALGTAPAWGALVYEPEGEVRFDINAARQVCPAGTPAFAQGRKSQ